jgi:hypothetical protein
MSSKRKDIPESEESTQSKRARKPEILLSRFALVADSRTWATSGKISEIEESSGAMIFSCDGKQFVCDVFIAPTTITEQSDNEYKNVNLEFELSHKNMADLVLVYVLDPEFLIECEKEPIIIDKLKSLIENDFDNTKNMSTDMIKLREWISLLAIKTAT